MGNRVRVRKYEYMLGDKVWADGLLCEVVDICEDEEETVWYGVTPVTGYARGFVREFTADKLSVEGGNRDWLKNAEGGNEK